MRNRLSSSWQKVPSVIRKPIVLLIGILLIVAAALTGWLPGPGGIPLFLLGIAILATEFEWAKAIRDRVLDWLKRFGHWFRENPFLGTLVSAAIIFTLIGLAILISRYVNHFGS